MPRISIKLTWPYIAVILAHIVWGVSFAVAKITLQEIPPMSLAFLRFFIAVVLLTPFIIVARKKVTVEIKDIPWLFLAGILMITLNIGFFYLGLSKTNVISASTLTLTIPILSIIGGWIFLKEKIYVVNLAGILIGLIGATSLIGLPFAALGIASWSSEVMVGNLYIIASSVSWVAGAIVSKNLLKKYSTLTVTFIIFLAGFITFIVPAVNEYLQNPQWVHQLTFLGIFGVFFSAIATSISAYFLFEWGVSKLGVIKADLFQYIEPLAAVTLGVVVLNEGLRFSYIIGAILIGLGAYWSTLVKDKHIHHKMHRV